MSETRVMPWESAFRRNPIETHDMPPDEWGYLRCPFTDLEARRAVWAAMSDAERSAIERQASGQRGKKLLQLRISTLKAETGNPDWIRAHEQLVTDLVTERLVSCE